MDDNAFPGPSLPELARTTLARTAAATVGANGPGRLATSGQIPVRAGRDGSPLLLVANGSLLEQWLTSCPDAVTVSAPARTPFSALRLAGRAQPVAWDRAAGITACTVAVRSVEFTGPADDPVQVPVEQYRAAAPDPLWRVAPGLLHHLEHAHTSELVDCVRAHGMPYADWVVPRGLDRYGLELLVLTTGGATALRLSFPGGPVTSVEHIPASIRTILTCRCQGEPGHRRSPRQGKRRP